MIGNQQDRTIARCGLDVFETVDVHDVVCRKVYPTRAEDSLAPGPGALPATPVHAGAETEGETLEGGQRNELFGSRFEDWSNVQRPRSNVCGIQPRVVRGCSFLFRTLDIGHWTLDPGY